MPTDPTLTAILVVLAVVVGAAFLHLAKRFKVQRLPYFAQEHLLSKGELVFYKSLAKALPDGLAISMKTRLSDVIGCTAEGWKAGFGAKISQKHVDFVAFDPATSAILFVVELDDKSHDRPDRQARDAFLNAALAAAGVPIIRVIAARSYDPDDLREQIEPVVRTAMAG